ncbi:MAG: hypothetical protein AAB502_06265 [Chloroflexota bacterium]
MTISHDSFAQAARQQAASLGYRNLPIVVMPQAKPLDTPEVIAERAERALPEILGLLASKPIAKPAQ